MQKDGGRKNRSRHVPPVDGLIEGVQLPGVVEAGKNERQQAQNIEVNRSGRADTPVVDKQPDHQVDHADYVLVVDGPVRHSFADHYQGRKLDIPAAQLVTGLAPGSDLLQHPRNIDALVDRIAGDLQQNIAGANARVIGFPARRHVQGSHYVLAVRGRAIHPDYAIFGQRVDLLVAEVDNGKAHRGYGEDEQQRAHELGFEIPQPALFIHNSLEDTLGSPLSLL